MFNPEEATELRGDRFYYVGGVSDEFSGEVARICDAACRRFWPNLTWEEQVKRVTEDLVDVGLVRARAIYIRASVAESLPFDEQTQLRAFFEGACAPFD